MIPSFGMEIGAEKTKQRQWRPGGGGGGEIKIKDRRLGAVASFKYLGAVVSDDGSRPVIHSLGLHKPL